MKVQLNNLEIEIPEEQRLDLLNQLNLFNIDSEEYNISDNKLLLKNSL